MGTSLFSPGLHAACIFAFAQPEVSDDCSSYALGFFSQPGGNDCTSSPNFIFSGAKMYGLGSASVTAGDLQLVCASLPFYTTGIFFCGPNAGSVPLGNGTLYVIQSVVRSQVFQADDTELKWDVKFGAQASSIHPIVAGATYNFQCCYRDPGGGSPYFNLSDGYRVQFTP